MKRSVVALALSFALAPRAAFAIVADQASDICPDNADPCLVQQAFDVVSGSILDFGTRTVEIATGGQIDTNAGEVTIRSGNFVGDATALTPGLKVRGLNGFGGIDGGTLTIEARRRCELDTERTCLSDASCSFGTCSVSVCSADNTTTCASDASCDLGTCAGDSTCTNAPGHSCLSDGDCKLGTCTINVCSASRTTTCATDNDCNFGTCSVGEGNVQLLTPVRADGGLSPGRSSFTLPGTSPSTARSPPIPIRSTTTAASSSSSPATERLR